MRGVVRSWIALAASCANVGVGRAMAAEPPAAIAQDDAPTPTRVAPAVASCGAGVMLVVATYADVATRVELPAGTVPPGQPGCFVCREGSFCALGTKNKGQRVVVKVEGRTVAVDEGWTTSETCDASSQGASPASPEPLPECATHDLENRLPWFVAVSGVEVPRRSVVTAESSEVAIHVMHRGTPPRRASFAVDVSAIRRWNSPLGSLGTGVGIASMTRSVRQADIAEQPREDDVSRLGLGLRYDAALFAQDWLHRLSVVAEYDLLRCHGITLTPGLALGVAASFPSDSSSTISAGLLVGTSLHLDWQVAWQVATVVGTAVQLIVVNGTTVPLWSGFIGPRVSW
jgi:hypothetical protein